MRRLKIGIDMDEVINNMVEKLLLEYNRKYYDNVVIKDITDWNIHRFLKPSCQNVFKEFCNFSFMINLDVADGAVEALTELGEHHDIYFGTAGFPNTMFARDQWLHKHFSFYRTGNLIACVNKQLLRLDVLDDDYEQNLIGGDYLGLLINKPWNQKFDHTVHRNLYRIDSVKEISKVLKEVCIYH